MKLFEVLPDRLFQLFTGKNRQIYAEAVLLLYEQYQENRFGIEYEIMRDLYQEMIEAQEESGLHFEIEEDSELNTPAETDAGYDLFRAKANALMRRLKALEWFKVEDRDNFRQYIVLPHYASRILAVLKELCQERTVEYQRYAFVTYQLLVGDEAKIRPAFAILEAQKMTEQFLDELTILANNMKHHVEQVAAKTSIQDVLDHHFDEYKAKIVDRSYHRLKTSDHVARYRHQILQTIQRWLLDDSLFAEAVEDGLRSEFFATREESEQGLRKALLAVDQVYRGLDDIIRQIDYRHNQYLRASYDRARYLSQHTQGLEQRIALLLEWLPARLSRESAPETELGSLFRLQQVEQLTPASLYVPRKKRTVREPQPHVPLAVPEELKKQLREQSLTKMQQRITREKIKNYVLSRLGEREEMGMEELAPQNLEEFLYLTYVYLYGYDGTAGYRLVRGEDRILTIGTYRFHDRRIQRLRKGKERT